MSELKFYRKKTIFFQLFYLICKLMLLAFIFLEFLIFPKENIKQLLESITLPSSITLLNIICISTGVITLISSTISMIYMKQNLKKEEEHLDIALSYIKILNYMGENKKSYERLLKNSLQSEIISKKEYFSLQKLYSSTYEQEDDSIIDSAKTGIRKIIVEKNLAIDLLDL